MYIKFKKAHNVGLAKGQICKVSPAFGNEMIDEKYAVEVEEKDFDTYKAEHLKNQESRNEEMIERSKHIASVMQNGSEPSDEEESEEKEEKPEESGNASASSGESNESSETSEAAENLLEERKTEVEYLGEHFDLDALTVDTTEDEYGLILSTATDAFNEFRTLELSEKSEEELLTYAIDNEIDIDFPEGDDAKEQFINLIIEAESKEETEEVEQ